jgi:hypothetical protein
VQDLSKIWCLESDENREKSTEMGSGRWVEARARGLSGQSLDFILCTVGSHRRVLVLLFFFLIVVLGVCGDIYQSSYDIS